MSNAGGLGSDTTVKVVGVSYFKLVVVFVLGFLTRGYLVVFDHEFQDYSVEGTSFQRPQHQEEDRNKPPPKQQQHHQHQHQQHHDILSHLPKCDQPQSPLSLAELAAQYRPSKFVRYAHTNFDRIYPQYLEPYRFKQFRMLEIGLDTGAGSLLWSEYFPCGVLYGLEYTERESHTPGARTIRTVTGDQGNRTFLQTEFLAQTDGGHFDVIIDDGGHHYEQQSLSYEVLFDRALTPGGVYFIEDIETSYWQPGVPLYNHPITRGGYAEPDTLINRFKLVIDVGTCRRCGESCTNSMCVDVSLCSVSRVLFCQFIIISLALSYYLFVPFFCVVFSGCHRYTI